MLKSNRIFMQWVLSEKRMGYSRLNKECFKFSNTQNLQT